MITTAHQEFLVKWLCERIGYVPTPHMKCIASVNEDNTVLKGVVGFDGYNGASVIVHMAGDHPQWIDKRLIYATFDYIFNTLQCNQLLAMVPSGNDRALEINKRFGLEVVVELEGAHPDGSLFVLRMKRENCKWLVPRLKH
jgi:hypothetical protein